LHPEKSEQRQENLVKCRVEVEELLTSALQGDQYSHFMVALCFCAKST
jgi:hypothetical protein